LNDLVEGFQILWRLGVKELAQCLKVGFDFFALGLGQASFFVEGCQYSGGHKFEGVKFLPELSWLLVASGDFFGLHQNLAVHRFDCNEVLPIVFERDGCGSSREGEEVVGIRVELDALVLRVGFEGEKSLAVNGEAVVEVGVVECQSFVGVHDCSWLLDRVLFAFGLVCVFCFVVGKENGDTLVESIKYHTFGGKVVTASVTKCE